MQIKGIVINKSDKSGTKKDGSNWTRWSFVLDNGKKCGTFTESIAENIHEKDSLEVEIDENNYNEIKEVISCDYDEKAASEVKDEAPKVTNAETSSPAKFTPQDYKDKQKYWEDKEERANNRDDKRQLLIIRQSCLAQANALIENMGALGFSEEDRKKLFLNGDPIEVVKNFAEKLVKYVLQE